MAKMTLTIPDEIVQDVVDAFCGSYKYQPEVEGEEKVDGETVMILNPESKVAFSKRMIREYVKAIYTSYQANQYEAGRQAVVDAAETDVAGMEMT